jgi:hypothetical protein
METGVYLNDQFATHSSEDETHGKEQFMENNIYHWQVEAMVYLRMREIKREMEKIALYQREESHRPPILERIAINIGKGLVALGRRVQTIYTDLDSQY